MSGQASNRSVPPLRRVLLTGATGYVGAHTARVALERGLEVHALVRPGSATDRLPPGVVRHELDGSYASVERAVAATTPDACIHLAAMVQPRPTPDEARAMLDAGPLLAVHLAEALTSAGGGAERPAVVSAGTYWEFAQDGSYAPNSLYAATKRATHDLLAAYVPRGLRAITLVLFDVYGPDDWRGKLLPALLKAAAEGRRLPATPGTQRLDMVHIDDVAIALLHAAETARAMPAPALATFAAGSGTPRPLREIVGLLERIAGRDGDPGGIADWGAVPFPPGQVHEPVSVLPRLPGWAPTIGLEQGLRAAWDRHAADAPRNPRS